MTRYRNLAGDSGVLAYELGDIFIRVQFNGATYTYTNRSAGSSNIQTMKNLAQRGHGLNTFINKYVKDKYESKS